MINNNNDGYNNIYIYNKVWNNNYLKKIILNYLSLFNILISDITFYNIHEWKRFKYKEFLYQVTFDFYMDLELLPSNIKIVTFSKMDYSKFNSSIKVPEWIKSVNLINIRDDILKSEYFKSISASSKLSGLLLYLNKSDELKENLFQTSITDLSIISSSLKLNKNVFPLQQSSNSNLKSLFISFLESLEVGALPDSLTRIDLYLKSPLNIINQFSKYSNLYRLSVGLSDEWSKKNSTIENNDVQLSNSLKIFEVDCFLFNSKLPSSLTELSIRVEYLDYEIELPPLLKVLSLVSNNNLSKYSANQLLKKDSLLYLKSLTLTCIQNSDSPWIPDNLESLEFRNLTIDIYDIIRVNPLPSSLTHIDFGFSFNQAIEVNLLPVNLYRLVLGFKYDKIIDPLAIPPNLEHLIIRNPIYPHHINLTHNPKTIIYCDNIDCYYNPNIQLPPADRLYKLKLPYGFSSSLSELQLQDKSNLEYLHLGGVFNSRIPINSLPINNNIKTLELSSEFSKTLNLEYFKNLETIVINSNSSQYPKITSSINKDTGLFNFYKLKNIIASSSCFNELLKELDSSFYKFLKNK